MSNNIEIFELSELPDSYLEKAVQLAYYSFEDFYSLISPCQEKLLPAISEQFNSLSELNQIVAAVEKERLVGIGSYYQLTEMSERQMAGMHSLLSVADDRIKSTKTLRSFMEQFKPPGEVGGYISRFAVSQEKRGTGLAINLINKVESVLRARDLKEIRLHVKKDNARALAFYNKAGYIAVDDQKQGYLLLGKTLGK